MKLLLLLFSIFLYNLPALAQTWDELNDSLLYYFNQRDNHRAIPFAEGAILAAKSESGELHWKYANTITYLAMLNENTGQNNKAESLYLKAINLHQKMPGDNQRNYASSLSNLAVFYRNTGKYSKAGALFLQAQAEIKAVLGEAHPDYAYSLYSEALLYQRLANYTKAEQLLIKAIAIQKLLEENQSYAYMLSSLAEVYMDSGKYDKAEPFYIQSTEVLKKIDGEDHISYASALNIQAVLMDKMGRYEKSEALILQAISIAKKGIGENNSYYASFIYSLGGVYNKMAKYEKAESLYRRSATIVEILSGKSHPNYSAIIQSLATLYQNLGNNVKAETLYSESLAEIAGEVGEAHPNYATGLCNLATLYGEMGNNDKAIQLLQKAISIYEKTLGDNHPALASGLYNLALVYREIGNYQQAESIQLRALEIQKIAIGEDHPMYATGLGELSLIYDTWGNYEKAETFLLQAMTITKKAYGADHPDYSTLLHNLARTYRNMGSYKKAEDLYLSASEIAKNVFGENHTSFATNQYNLALLYHSMGKFDKAEKLLLNAKKIFGITLGEDHIHYSATLNSLGIVYKDLGDYQKAELFFKQAIAIRKKQLGNENPDYAVSLNNLSELYQIRGDYFKAEPLLTEVNRINIRTVLELFNVMSEKEKGNYLLNNVHLNNSNNSFLFNYKHAGDSTYRDNYNLQLLLKSLSLENTKNSLEAVRNSSDLSITKTFSSWQSNKSILAKQYSLPVAKRMEGITELEAKTENLEKQLARHSKEFEKQQNNKRISLEDVQKNLDENEVAIEFVSFRVFNKKWTDSIMYAAYILRKHDLVPEFVVLFEEKQLQALLDSAGNTSNALVSSFYRNLSLKKKNTVFLGENLYKMIWEPLEPYLKGVGKVSYSPAGKLHGIAFNALSIDSSSLLMDKYQLIQYTNTRQVALRNTQHTGKGSGIILFGDPSFSVGQWKELEGTASEVKSIGDLFVRHKRENRSFVKEKASEENLKALSGHSPRILHIATHGFFLPAPGNKNIEETEPGLTYSLANDPLLRSGLVLAKGNDAWNGNTVQDGGEDGIATAYEISQLNLSNTELIVLSACETALGDVKGSEGVYGLQRAFKMAGVKKMIVSLWQVPDKETAELMTAFYTYYLTGKSIEESFSKAQSEMRKKYSPFYWAAFVLVE